MGIILQLLMSPFSNSTTHADCRCNIYGTNQEFLNSSAFAVLKEDGSVITWGDHITVVRQQCCASELQSGVTQISPIKFICGAEE